MPTKPTKAHIHTTHTHTHSRRARPCHTSACASHMFTLFRYRCPLKKRKKKDWDIDMYYTPPSPCPWCNLIFNNTGHVTHSFRWRIWPHWCVYSPSRLPLVFELEATEDKIEQKKGLAPSCFNVFAFVLPVCSIIVLWPFFWFVTDICIPSFPSVHPSIPCHSTIAPLFPVVRSSLFFFLSVFCPSSALGTISTGIDPSSQCCVADETCLCYLSISFSPLAFVSHQKCHNR